MSRLQQVLVLLGTCACLQVIVSTPTSTFTPTPKPTVTPIPYSTFSAKGCQGLTAQEEEDCLDAIAHPDLREHDLTGATQRQRVHTGEDASSYWLQHSKELLRERVANPPNMKTAKNIILFLGDGMGLTTLAAARTLLGDEAEHLSFEAFPSIGLSRTYCVDSTVADSASTATAYLCGVKANYGTIGVNGMVERYNCNATSQRQHHVQSIGKWAMDAGKAAGLVTTTRVTHASPAGVYAHTADRDWENDASVKSVCGADTALEDIAQQLMHGEVGSKLKVVLGGGKAEFVDANATNGEGYRSDGRNLIDEFLKQSAKNVYVETLDELKRTNPMESKRLLGLFQDSHMDYHLDAQATQPTLEDMTRKALEFMGNEENGYFLFIEGGRIDHGHHNNKARLALDETIEFSKAIALARSMTSEDDTLIVVTSDHSHAFSFSGYQRRDSDIFDITPTTAEDNEKYLALSYANGPSFNDFYDTENNGRRSPKAVLNNQPHDTFPSTAPLSSETHGGEDVGVFASGPWSHLFSGVYEQSAIPHMMAFAACVGDGLTACM